MKILLPFILILFGCMLGLVIYKSVKRFFDYKVEKKLNQEKKKLVKARIADFLKEELYEELESRGDTVVVDMKNVK